MPKFRINCSTSRSYTLLVEAPTQEAASRFYNDCDSSEFGRCDDGLAWNMDDMFEEDTSQGPDVRVDREGKKLGNPVLGTCDLCGDGVVRDSPSGNYCEAGCGGGGPYSRGE